MSFLNIMETVIDEVSDWGVKAVDDIVSALMPDGRPFQMANKTDVELLTEYVGVKGNPEAWATWIDTEATEIIKRLQDAAVSPDEIKAIHPIDIAIKMALVYNSEMEKLLDKEIK